MYTYIYTVASTHTHTPLSFLLFHHSLDLGCTISWREGTYQLILTYSGCLRVNLSTHLTYLDSKGTADYGVCSLLVTRFNNVYYQDHNQSLTLSINNKALHVIKASPSPSPRRRPDPIPPAPRVHLGNPHPHPHPFPRLPHARV